MQLSSSTASARLQSHEQCSVANGGANGAKVYKVNRSKVRCVITFFNSIHKRLRWGVGSGAYGKAANLDFDARACELLHEKFSSTLDLFVSIALIIFNFNRL